MDNKRLGVILIVLAIALAVLLGFLRWSLEQEILARAEIGPNGECLHVGETCPYQELDKYMWPTLIGSALLILVFGLGIYLVFFDKSQKAIMASQEKIAETIKETKDKEVVDERFNLLLSALDEEEKKVMIAVKEQDGISQTTLMYRTDLSKTKLSLVLTGLEKKDLIKKVKKGKINLIHMKKAF